MKKLVLVTHPFSDDEAEKVADQIKHEGDIRYTDASGSDVRVTVGSVTIENAD